MIGKPFDDLLFVLGVERAVVEVAHVRKVFGDIAEAKLIELKHHVGKLGAKNGALERHKRACLLGKTCSGDRLKVLATSTKPCRDDK